MIPLRSREGSLTAEIAALFEPDRARLGKKFDSLVEEISAVRYEYLKKREALPKTEPGMLDGPAAVEERRLGREEALKWALIKQKYGL